MATVYLSSEINSTTMNATEWRRLVPCWMNVSGSRFLLGAMRAGRFSCFATMRQHQFARFTEKTFCLSAELNANQPVAAEGRR